MPVRYHENTRSWKHEIFICFSVFLLSCFRDKFFNLDCFKNYYNSFITLSLAPFALSLFQLNSYFVVARVNPVIFKIGFFD